MASLRADSAVTAAGEGRYSARISSDWNLIGPNGGYLAAIALRAAAAESGMSRPSSLSCHYLEVPAFDAVELRVSRMRCSRRAESLRVSMHQGGKHILEALVWATLAELRGPVAQWRDAPPAGAPGSYPAAPVGGIFQAASFYKNMEIRPVFLPGESEVPGKQAVVRSWSLLRPEATFQDDAWLDACRYVVHLDAIPFGAVAMGFPRLTFMASSLDLYVAFHAPDPMAEFLLVEGRGVAANGGTVAGEARIWSPQGWLIASGSQQMLTRSFPGV